MSETRAKVEAAVARALEEALPALGEVDPDAALTGDLGLDSVQIMNLVMEIEDNLDLSVPVDVLAEVRTLNQLIERLVKLKDKQA